MKRFLSNSTTGYASGEYFPYGDFLQEHLGGDSRVDHIGLCGWTTLEMVLSNDEDEECFDCFRNSWQTLKQKLLSTQYSYVFILVGTNDLGKSGCQSCSSSIIMTCFFFCSLFLFICFSDKSFVLVYLQTKIK